MSNGIGIDTLYDKASRYISEGNWGAAETTLSAFLSLAPSHAQAHLNYGMVLRTQGNLQGAVNAWRRALALDPDYCIALNNLGAALSELGKTEEAITLYEHSLSVAPGEADTHNNLGAALFELERLDEAEHHFRLAVRDKPDRQEYAVNLGNLMLKSERWTEAQEILSRALAIKDDDPSTMLKLGYTQHRLKRHGDAMKLMLGAISLDPAFAEAHAALARLYQEDGDFDAARAHLRRAIALNPEGISQYLSLAHISRLEPDDPIVVALLGMRDAISDLEESQRIAAHFSLAKILHDLGQHEGSFQHLLAGNRLRRLKNGYDERATLSGLQRIKTAMTAEKLLAWPHASPAKIQPIFIVGMPRSGSTLVEQILSQHGQILTAGESEALPNTLKYFRREIPEWRYPAPDFAPKPELLGAVADHYLQALIADLDHPSDMKEGLFITDKMLGNFRHIGLIRHLFPNARIIHTFRDPIETCLSCFAINFTTQPFAFDLGDLGRYYRAYAIIMRHWRQVLPPGKVFDVRYEAVVLNFEASAKAIIAHCGLEWDDACLRFHEAKRPVTTASVAQVRRPIYSTSLKRWKPDSSGLKPLYDGLGIAPPP